MTKQFQSFKLAGFTVTFKRSLMDEEKDTWRQDIYQVCTHATVEYINSKKAIIICPEGMWQIVKKVLEQDTIIQSFKGATIYLKEDA